MNSLKELSEARQVAYNVISEVNQAINTLNRARSWGIWDIFLGGLLMSSIKRNKIEQANQEIYQISKSLERLQDELDDVQMILPQTVSNSTFDKSMDIWFDNLFTDFKVQGQIKKSLEQLNALKDYIEALILQLDAEIKVTEQNELF
ncbi:hypothetical protein [Ignavigranum ruoffiae]|uniref:hypothetical protein n=1 Tax=Ignavigranum ruoffiae TaxID=89093 RepID=UPI0024AD2112|nr:hypothetical protein [Ignavigranum ruoffiae]